MDYTLNMTTNMIKPNRLKRGDTIAVVSPSWGGPSKFPHIYESGLNALSNLGFNIKEYPSARSDAQYLYENPRFRANDINQAFADNSINGIIASIGGDDSVRILPFLDKQTITKNPKFLMGYSDTTILTTFCNQLGLVTFNGPCVMAGFSQMDALGDTFKKHITDFLFDKYSSYTYTPYAAYSNNYPDWSDIKNTGMISDLIPTSGWNWLQGQGIVEGTLFGGCIEVFEFLKGTTFWFEDEFWKNKILFFETSEDKPTVSQVKYFLRNYGSQGILNNISALLFGRARDYSDKEKAELEETILKVIDVEFGRKDMPVITNMDFGHTDPQIILPLGIKAQLDHENKAFTLLESPWS